MKNITIAKATVLAISLAVSADAAANAYSCSTAEVAQMQGMAAQLEGQDVNELSTISESGETITAASPEELANVGYELATQAGGPLMNLGNCAMLFVGVASNPTMIADAMCAAGCVTNIAKDCKFKIDPKKGIVFSNSAAAPICMAMLPLAMMWAN